MVEYSEIINQKILEKYACALVIDINKDKIYKYINKDGKFIKEKELSYVEYINKCQDIIYEDDLQAYLDSLSINKLEENKRTDLHYRMLSKELGTFMDYVNSVYLYDDNGNKLIVVIVSLISNHIEEKTTNNSKSVIEQKHHKMIDNISLALLKIHNALNMDHNLRAKDEYINSLITSLTADYPELNKSFNENASEVYNSGKSSVLIADDDKIICTLLSKIFSEKYNIIIANNGDEAIKLLSESKSNSTNISCVFLDLIMPVVDGFSVLEYLDENNYFSRMPIIIISGNYDRDTKNRIYNYPIADMLEKPFNAEIIKHRVENLINLYGTSSILNEMMIEQQGDLRKIINATIKSYEYDYASLIKYIKEYMQILTSEFAKNYPEYNITPTIVDKIVNSSIYFAMGNYILPKTIYGKKSVNSPEDKKIINNAIVNSASIIKYVVAFNNRNIDSRYATEIVKYYTERYDGLGYPEGLKGEDIPISAQLVSLVVEYINLARIKPTNFEQIFTTITNASGSKFNPKVIETYKIVHSKFDELAKF